MRRWAIVAKPLVSLLAICVTLVALELVFRLYQKVRFDVPVAWAPVEAPRHVEQGRGNNLAPLMLDDRLGWKSTPNYEFHGPRQNLDGSAYHVDLSFDERGFRRFGDPEANRLKIFAIGDSFTQAVEASNGRAYHELVGEMLNAETFVYGAGGYGTLQEYMLLDTYLERVRPDLVLWQFCSNDFINNEPGLEAQSILNNNSLVRPYLIDDEIRYVLPTTDPFGIRSFVFRYSRLGYWLLSRWNIIQLRLFGSSLRSVEHDIEQQGFQHQGFVRAVGVTERIVARLRERVGPTPIVAFSCDDDWPYYDAFREISGRHAITFVEHVGRAVQDAEQRGMVVKVHDGRHWNERGHEVVAGVIVSAIREAGLVRQ